MDIYIYIYIYIHELYRSKKILRFKLNESEIRRKTIIHPQIYPYIKLKESKRKKTHIHTHTHTHIYIYIYIYIYTNPYTSNRV